MYYHMIFMEQFVFFVSLFKTKLINVRFFFIFIGGELLYNIVLVLPYINMNLPQVYMCSPSWTPLPPPSPYIPLGYPSAPAPSFLYPASNLDWWLSFLPYLLSLQSLIYSYFACHFMQKLEEGEWKIQVSRLHICTTEFTSYSIIWRFTQNTETWCG